MIRLLSVFFALMFASAAQAQVESGNYTHFQTRFGAIEIIGERGNQSLAFEGTPLPLGPEHVFDIWGAFGLADADHDWVLAQDHHGGNSCGPGITVIRVSVGQVQMSGATEWCEGRIFDLRVYPDALELDIFSDAMETQFTTFHFDGSSVTATLGELAFTDGTIAGPGADALRWVGQHPYRIFEDLSERGRFLNIMTAENIRDMSDRIGPANSVIQRGDWVLGAGCMAHACNISGAVWGIRVSDGAPAAAILDAGQADVIYGPMANDPVFSGWINEHRN